MAGDLLSASADPPRQTCEQHTDDDRTADERKPQELGAVVLVIFRTFDNSYGDARTANHHPEVPQIFIRSIKRNGNLIRRSIPDVFHLFKSCNNGNATEHNARPHALSHATASDLSCYSDFGIRGDFNRVTNTQSRRSVGHF